LILLIVLIIQIVYGAFVAGLDAGKVYNTWPKMNERWVAEAVYAMSPLWQNFVNGLAGVQFIHRELAYIVLGLTVYIFFRAKSFELIRIQQHAINLLLITVSLQVILGITTLLMGVPIWLGVAHQIGAFLLLGASVFSVFIFKENK
jgi:cytochrome c oxidase assembly protein subunit 15